MTILKKRIYLAIIPTFAILLAGCSIPTVPNQEGAISSGQGPTSIGNLTGGSEARPTSDPGVTPGPPPGK